MKIQRRIVWVFTVVIAFTSVNEMFGRGMTVVRAVAGEVRVLQQKNSAKKVTSYKEQFIQKSKEFPLVRGDKVVTGKYGIALIRFGDGSTLWMDSGSVLRIKELNLALVEGQSYNVQLNMSVGRVRVEVPQVRGVNKKFQVHTPEGTASVRGTEKLVIFDRNIGTRVHVLRGKVELSDIIGESKVLDVGQEGKIGTSTQQENAERIDFQFGSLESVKAPRSLGFAVDSTDSLLIYREKENGSIIIESPIGNTPQNVLEDSPEYWELNWWVSHIPKFYILSDQGRTIQVKACRDSNQESDCSTFAQFNSKQREYETIQRYMGK